MSELKRSKPLAGAVLSAAIVLIAGAVGSLATLPNIPTWYAHLHKPAFTPPNWVFGPAWTTLYILMAVAFWRVLTLSNPPRGKGVAITAFLVQILLNAFWSIAFFGLHAPLYGLIAIGCLLMAIITTMVAFAPLDRWASILLVPYVLWVLFASALNAAVFWLNR